MKFHLFLFPFLICFSSCTNSGKLLSSKAFHILSQGLSQNERWEKVHAAEFLLDLGHEEHVRTTFLSEYDQYGHVPQYRIGIWRVLYKCSEGSEKKKYGDSIYQAFVRPDSPDRLHAVETLAKLNMAKRDADTAIIASALTSTDLQMCLYTRWWVLPQQENGIDRLKNLLFGIIRSGQNDEPVRRLAAYIIREDRSIVLTLEEWMQMKDIAVAEPISSTARAQLLATLFSKASCEVTMLPGFGEVKKALLRYKESEVAHMYQLCLAFAEKGTSGDVRMLASLLDNESDDVKNAAAYAILRIVARNKEKY
ncbi:MAG: hypothetical protein LBQ60_15840 [Bacteroidales bacterium]|jgi:hypothetical protein|nr:hypothetical protein [Bacteroidales bacterium]